jgi:hypothetical protein
LNNQCPALNLNIQQLGTGVYFTPMEKNGCLLKIASHPKPSTMLHSCPQAKFLRSPYKENYPSQILLKFCTVA